MVSNIGYGEDATHTHDLSRKPSDFNVQEFEMPWIHPSEVIVNRAFDNALFFKEHPRYDILQMWKHYLSVVRWRWRVNGQRTARSI